MACRRGLLLGGPLRQHADLLLHRGQPLAELLGELA